MPNRGTFRRAVVSATAVLVALLAVPAGPSAPASAQDGDTGLLSATVVDDPPVPLDCDDWRYGPDDEPADLPDEYDRDDYRRTSRRDPRPELSDSPQNHCGQKGAAVDLAWGLSTGTPDVLIAVLDSGIRWRDASSMVQLATNAHINLGEARPPCAAVDGDCNGDGRFDIRDFGEIADLNGNGLADPEDLILDPAFSDGVDDDGDGYVDNISGWDFLYGDNNPLDTVDYGHGTGEAKDSAAVADGTGDVGVCPGCTFLPVRVSDSFIADGGRFAAGVLYALDEGADVVQEALGALSNPVQAQQAIDAAYERGVVVVASMADEAAAHPNLPSSLERTMAVNSVTEKSVDLLGPAPVEGYLALNGCTNFGGRTFVSVPSSSCSSEATGLSAGMIGLVESYAREIGLDPHPDLVGLTGRAGGDVLSANEAMQLVRSTADDIDFSTPNDVDPANNFGTSSGNPLLDTVRYPTRPGWDQVHGYGRINAYELLRAVDAGAIPPEADITGPLWFDVLPATGTVDVTGRVAAVRADSYDYRLEWAPGVQGPEHPGTDLWRVVDAADGLTAPLDGVLGSLDLAAVAAELTDGAGGAPVGDDGRPDPERFAVRLRVVVTAHGGGGDGLRGEMQKQVFVHDDPDLVGGFPRRVDGVGGASPAFTDVDGDGAVELVLGTDDGTVHAWRADGTEIDGFPIRTDVSSWWPTGSPTAAAEGIEAHRGTVGLGGPALGDLDRDGTVEVVVPDANGAVAVFGADGERRATATIDPAFSLDDRAGQDRYNRTKPGFLSSPSLGDLDGDGDLEIVAAALDRHVYAWHHDGTPVAGFPVLLVDPAKVDSIDPTSHRVTFAAGSGAQEGGELLATPALADLDGDGRPEIVVGAQEQYGEAPNVGDGAAALGLLTLAGSAGNSRVYAISPDGTDATVSAPVAGHPSAQAYLPGWPVKVAMASTNLLPTIGDGVAMPAAIADVVPDSPGPEVVVASAAGPVYAFTAAGEGAYGSTAAGDLPMFWSAGLGGEDAGVFGAARNTSDLIAQFAAFGGPSVGDLDGDGDPDVTAPTAGLTRLIDLLVSDLQLPNDDALSAWEGATRLPLPGSPQATADLAFFVAPAIADLDGDGRHESIAGNGHFTLAAHDGTGAAPDGWPKLTGGWTVGTPAVGDWDGDGSLEVAQARRDGVLMVWTTGDGTATDGAVAWGGWGCDSHHSGACVDTTPGASAADRYVDAVYRQVLGRGADAAGLAYWTGRLDGGLPRGRFTAMVVATAEARDRVCRDLYGRILLRNPGAAEVAWCRGLLASGLDAGDVTVRLAASQEAFIQADNDPTVFVALLYDRGLGRRPPLAEIEPWAERLRSGRWSRSAVAIMIVDGAEARRRFVVGVYVDVLGRSPGVAERDFWSGRLAAGHRDRAVRAAVLASDEFHRLA